MNPRRSDEVDRSLGEIVSEVSEKASLLVREEIELAKTEMTTKAKTLARGAGVGAAAGVFLLLALFMFLHTLSWFFLDLFDFEKVWLGFAITTLLLVLMGALAGYLAYRWLRTGPPTPDAAIEEAKRTREMLSGGADAAGLGAPASSGNGTSAPEPWGAPKPLAQPVGEPAGTAAGQAAGKAPEPAPPSEPPAEPKPSDATEAKTDPPEEAKP